MHIWIGKFSLSRLELAANRCKNMQNVWNYLRRFLWSEHLLSLFKCSYFLLCMKIQNVTRVELGRRHFGTGSMRISLSVCYPDAAGTFFVLVMFLESRYFEENCSLCFLFFFIFITEPPQIQHASSRRVDSAECEVDNWPHVAIFVIIK